MTDRQPTRLRELLSRSTETAEIQPDKSYKEITVRLWGKGVVLRGIVDGSELHGSRRFVARKGQLILSRIDARNGAIGIVPETLDGSVVSNDFPLFTLNERRVLPRYFEWLSKTKPLVRMCQAASEGTTNRVRLQEDRLLNLEIPLPPLPEQRRIVARIEELIANISEARLLRNGSAKEADRLLVCMARRDDLTDSIKATGGWKSVRLGDLMRLVDDSHPVRPDSSFPNFGIYSFGRGLFRKPPIDGALTRATTLRRVRKGQFIYSRLFAFEGAYGYINDDFDGCFVSNEYPTFDCDESRVRVEFIAAYFKSPAIWKELAAGSTGLGDRRQRVQPDRILSHTVWLPPLEWQERIARLQEHMDQIKALQAQTAAELDALMRSILDKAFKAEL